MIPMSTETWRWTTIASVAVASAAVSAVLFAPRVGLYHAQEGRYADWLRIRLRRLHASRKPATLVDLQLVLVGLGGFVAALGIAPLSYALVLVASSAFLPPFVLERLVARRLARLDAQADSFCLALANALKANANIGAALESLVTLLEAPIAQELDLAMKETRVGRPLGEALQELAVRTASQKIGTIIAAVLIGRQVGGNLPKLLETTAATLREITRLEGVIRQKTATGRMQIWGMSILPIVVIAGTYVFKPDFFAPLTASAVGYAIATGGLLLYVASLALARKILAVDV
jgi:tight adherence protein B